MFYYVTVRCYKYFFPQFNQFESVSRWLNTDNIALAKLHWICDVRFKPAVSVLWLYRRLTCIMKGHTIGPSSNLIAFFQSNLTILSGLILTSVHTRWIKLLNNQFYKHFMPNFQHVIKLSFFVNVFRLYTNSSSIPIISKRETVT